MRKSRLALGIAAAGIACVHGIANPAWAQQSSSGADPFAGVEELIVTGSGTEGLLNPANSSTIGFDASDMDSFQIEDLSDVADYVPNLQITNPNATNAAFFVRGVGLQDFGANASSSVPIFQDGIPRNPSATQLVGLFDIAGISVRKGPQGSGLFRNASAGAFVIQTAKATQDYTGYAKFSTGRIVSVDARDANRYEFEGAVNAPVVEDFLSARLAVRYKHENPFFENGCANRSPIESRPVQRNGQPSVAICNELVQNQTRSQVHPFLDRFLGEVDDYGLRGQLHLEHPDLPIDWTVRAELSRLNRDAVVGQTFGTRRGVLGGPDSSNYRDPDIQRRVTFYMDQARPQNPGLSNSALEALILPKVAKELYKDPLDRRPFRGDFDAPGRLILETRSVTLSGVTDLDDFDIETNLGYIDYRKSQRQDTDLSPNRRFPTISDDQAWEYYGDFAFKGDELGTLPFEWSTGAYGMVQKVEANQLQFAGNFDRDTEFTEETYSFGAFAQGAYEVLEGLRLEGGIRYNWERKDFDIKQLVLNAGAIPPDGSDNSVEWDAFTGMLGVSYDFTEEISTYLRYSRGYKPGQFNPSRPDLADVPGRGYADPESIDSIEWGVSFAAFSNRVTGNTAFFFYNYDNYQVFRLTTTPAGVFREVQNAEQARNYGAEVEFILQPIEGFVPEAIDKLQVVLRGGWLEATYVEFTNTEERFFGAGLLGVSINYSGRSLISSPNLQASGTITWPVDVSSIGTFTPQYDFTWQDDTPFDPNDGRGEVDVNGNSRFSPYLVGNRAYMLHNVRLGWSPPDRPGLEVAGWCRNVTDQRYKTFAVDISTFNGQQLIYVGDPRTCGADVRFTW